MKVVQRLSRGRAVTIAATILRRRRLTLLLLILAAITFVNAALPADIPVTTTDTASTGEHGAADRTDDQKTRARNTVVLMAIVTGIALTGLLLVIIAVAARGLTRKLATREIEESQALPDEAIETPLDPAASPTPEPKSGQPPRDAP